MRLPMRDTPWDYRGDGLDVDPWRTCPVCNQAWRPWHGSRLPCHNRCLFTPEEQDALLDEQGVTVDQQARRLGVTTSVILSAHRIARKRRR